MTDNREADTLSSGPAATTVAAPVAARRERVLGTLLGVGAGGAAGAVGAVFLAPWAPSVMLSAVLLAAVGGVLGYYAGRRVAGAILDAFTTLV